MIPKKIYYNNKEIIVSKIWLDDIEIFNNPNNLTPIPKPCWKYLSGNNIYLKIYTNNTQTITSEDFMGENQRVYNNNEISIEGQYSEIGERYADKLYTVIVKPGTGYCWDDGTTTELTFNWMIVNIDWAENKEGIYTIPNRNEDCSIEIYNDLYISPTIIEWIGNSHSDWIRSSSEYSTINISGDIKSGSIKINCIKNSYPMRSKDVFNIHFYIEDLEIYPSVELQLDLPPIPLTNVTVDIEPEKINTFGYGNIVGFTITFNGLPSALEEYGIPGEYAWDIVSANQNLELYTNYSETLISEDSPYEVSLNNDSVVLKRWLTNINTTPNYYYDLIIYFGLNNFEVSGFTDSSIAFEGKISEVKIDSFEPRLRHLNGPTESSVFDINVDAYIGPFNFNKELDEEVRPIIEFIDKGQFSNGTELSDVSGNFTAEWDSMDNNVVVWKTGNDESLNFPYYTTLTLPMKITIPQQNLYPEASWEFWIKFMGNN